MAGIEDVQPDNGNDNTVDNPGDYDPTINTPEGAASADDDNPNPAPGENVDDDPPAGDQEPADGALDENGEPRRSDGYLPHEKGEDD